METLFATSSQDEFGARTIELLKQLGAKTEVLPPGVFALWGSIAVFKALRGRPTGAGHYMKTASLKLGNDLTPAWAQTTPFRVELYETQDRRPSPRSRTDTPSTFRRALQNLWQMYRNWNPGNAEDPIPWTRTKTDPSIVDHAYEKLATDWYTHHVKSGPWLNLGKTLREQMSTERLTDRRITAGSWYVNICDRKIVFPKWAQRAGLGYLQAWQTHFADEQTWAKKEMGVPSLLVRLDCVLIGEELRVYEVEERPAGVGITNKMNAEFADGLADLRRFWPNFKVLISSKRTGGDDHLWAEVARPNGFGSEIFLVRAEPEETAYHKYSPRSISSVITKGNKSYGVSMGFWKSVGPTEAELPWDDAFVIKPQIGSKCHDIEVWLPPHSPQAQRFKNGSSTRAKIIQALERRGRMYLQPFYSPMEVDGAPDMHMILRVFYGFGGFRNDWICLGGCWNARSNVVVHGASDAVFGPVVLG